MREPTGAAADRGNVARRGRCQLRIYLGSAPGVGKTYAMLNEAHRRLGRGTDLVVGFVETHGRAKTAALLDGLEVIPRRTIHHRGTAFEEMDIDAVLARRPHVAVVDELAHTNIPGSRNAKRWQDVEELLDAGITVLSTVNVQHLESLNDVVQTITGVPQRETVPDEVVRSAEQVELIDITPEALRRRMAHGTSRRRLPRITGGLGPRRRLAGAVLAVVLLPLLTFVLSHLRGTLDLTSDILMFLLAVVAVALVGGLWPAIASAVAGSLLLNYYFTPPLHEWIIAERNNALALLVFIAVAAMVSTVVDLAARRTSEAARASAEAETLSTLAGDVLRGDSALSALLERVRQSFALSSVALLERGPDGAAANGAPERRGRFGRLSARPPDADTPWADGARHRGWHLVAASGPDPCRRPEEGDTDVPVGDDLALVLRGRALPAEDRRVLAAFGAQAAVALQQQRLAEAAAEAEPLAEADRTRTALLAAVSHDLRSPLASAKAAVTALRSADVPCSAEEQAELLATADESVDRLTRLVENLLDMSRLQAGALSVFPRPVGLDDVLSHVLDELGPAGHGVDLRIADDLPEVRADPGLLERIVANLAANALRHSPPEVRPMLSASVFGDRVELRVVDRGPGVPETEWDSIFVPFQRLGDRDNTTGVGLGLALSRGLAEAMGGTLSPEHTPGGGLTMVLALPAAPAAHAAHTVPGDGDSDDQHSEDQHCDDQHCDDQHCDDQHGEEP
jgi:K+-sensing histidine kinase KdpD